MSVLGWLPAGEKEYNREMIDTYGKHLTSDRMHELYDMTDADFDREVFKDASPSEHRNPLDVFTKKELGYILDYSQFLGPRNRDWIASSIFDQFFET